MNDKNLCRICGWFYSDEFFPWGEDGKLASFDICDCCGCTFGYQDCQLSAIKSNRQKWLDGGAKWWWKKTKPADWSYEKALEQLKNVPIEFK